MQIASFPPNSNQTRLSERQKVDHPNSPEGDQYAPDRDQEDGPLMRVARVVSTGLMGAMPGLGGWCLEGGEQTDGMLDNSFVGDTARTVIKAVAKASYLSVPLALVAAEVPVLWWGVAAISSAGAAAAIYTAAHS